MFESFNGDTDIQKNHVNNKGNYVITAGITNNGILGKSDIKAKIFDKNTITLDMFGFAFFRNFEYKIVTHARVFSLKTKFTITEKQGLFLSNSLFFLNKKFGYENMCSWEKIKKEKIQLPIKNNQIDFEFMEKFITELEKQYAIELNTYLSVSGLKNYELTEEEKRVLKDFENIKWNSFNLKKLFGNATRGKRLKSKDRFLGKLPFVTAGEKDEGISDFISNNVNIFSRNTITIDMFGSAKYRNYEYGADDHIAVIHTEKLSKFAAIFITTAVHKSSYTEKFSYSRNFYPKDADELYIKLPTKNSQPDYETMEIFISAIQKLVIKDVVLYSEKKLNTTKSVVNK